MKDSSKVYDVKRASMRFILMMGLVSLFGDMAYEGARSSTGAFMATLGASAGAVGFVVGLESCLATPCAFFPVAWPIGPRHIGRWSFWGMVSSCVFPCSQWRPRGR
ncbi:MAG: hypothetical protein ABC360_04700 [Acetomicrobium sp.]